MRAKPIVSFLGGLVLLAGLASIPSGGPDLSPLSALLSNLVDGRRWLLRPYALSMGLNIRHGLTPIVELGLSF